MGGGVFFRQPRENRVIEIDYKKRPAVGNNLNGRGNLKFVSARNPNNAFAILRQDRLWNSLNLFLETSS
jgi:hypothetical protein